MADNTLHSKITDKTTKKTALIVDDNEVFSTVLARSFEAYGYDTVVCTSVRNARIAVDDAPPSLIVSELRVDGEWFFKAIDHFRTRAPDCPLVVATMYPSVATAVQAIRLGCSAYAPKPLTVPTILQLAGLDDPPPCSTSFDEQSLHWPSLDRTIWEYINQVFVCAGSMSGAARRLGLDRRSLRRMLGKYPPRH